MKRIIATTILLFCSLSAHANERVTVKSSTTDLSLSFRLPSEWAYDGKPRSWPSYQEWPLMKGECEMKIAIFRHQLPTQSDDCGGPVGTPPKTIGHASIDGQTIPLKVTYNPIDHSNEAWANLRIGKSDIYFELNDTNRKELDRNIPEFLSFVRSVRVERK